MSSSGDNNPPEGSADSQGTGGGSAASSSRGAGFRRIESIAPYEGLVPDETRAQQLERFVEDWLTPELGRLNELRIHAIHKQQIHEMGMIAMGINSQLASWLPRARKQRRDRVSEVTREVVEQSDKRVEIGHKKLTERDIKHRIEDQMSTWDALVDSLQMVHANMNNVISFSQSSMRSITSDELGGSLVT